MKILYVIPSLLLLGILIHSASADTYISHKEFAGYFDHDGNYAVYGAVKNTGNQPVIAKVKVTVINRNNTFSESRILPVIYPLADMPFKFVFPKVNDGNPTLENPQVSFIETNSEPLNLAVIYDNTLKKYPDGHLTGFIKNIGNETIRNIDIYALVHDRSNSYLDEVQSTWTIGSINPDSKAQFVMYPDPIVAKKVYYYSCFIPGTDNFIELSTPLNGRPFYFSVLSIVYFTNQRFEQGGGAISFNAANPWQIPYYANFMFPGNSSNGNFQVFIDGKKVDSLISIENDTGNWHVAFNVDYGQHKVTISGFNPGYIPNNEEYFYLNAKSALTAWAGFATFTISDHKLLQVLGIQGSYIPPWVKTSVGYMIYNNVPPDSIVNEIRYLHQVGVVR